MEGEKISAGSFVEEEGSNIFAAGGKGLIDFDSAVSKAVMRYFYIIVWYIALCVKEKKSWQHAGGTKNNSSFSIKCFIKRERT